MVFMESNENIIIKAFITKCTAHVKYRYYAKKAREESFVAVCEKLEEIAQNELYHAFALLKRLGFDESSEVNLTDVVEGEKQDIERYRKLISENYNVADILEPIIDIDLFHLKTAEQLLTEMKSENAYKIKKCALCGQIDKSGNTLKSCPKCGYNK